MDDLDKRNAYIRTETVNMENLKQELIEDGILDVNGQFIKDEKRLKGEAGKLYAEVTRIRNLSAENQYRASEIKSALDVANRERLQQLQTSDNLAAKLKSLDDSRQQKMDNLEQRSEDTYKAVSWIQSNKQKFKKTVFEPVALEINVLDKR
jgi:flagellar motility protein MotE (MotC chaperone)